jgi:hypothetical protein
MLYVDFTTCSPTRVSAHWIDLVMSSKLLYICFVKIQSIALQTSPDFFLFFVFVSVSWFQLPSDVVNFFVFLGKWKFKIPFLSCFHFLLLLLRLFCDLGWFTLDVITDLFLLLWDALSDSWSATAFLLGELCWLFFWKVSFDLSPSNELHYISLIINIYIIIIFILLN